MKSIEIKNFLMILFFLLLMNFQMMGKNQVQALDLEKFFIDLKNAVEKQDLKAISSFYDQNQTEFFNKEMNKWKNIFSFSSTKDLKIKYYLLGGNEKERIIIYEMSSPDPLFSLLFANTIRPYVLRKTNEGWKLCAEKRLSDFYLPLAEEIDTAVNPSGHEIYVTQKLRLSAVRDNIPAVFFLLSDELKVTSCSERGKSLPFDQAGYILHVKRPLSKSEEKLTLTVKYDGRVERYEACNDHYVQERGGILRSENFWHISLSTYDEFLPRPAKITIDLPNDFFAVADSGRLLSCKEKGSRLIQRWDVLPADSLNLGFIFYNGWVRRTYETGMNKLIFCLDKDSKLEGDKVITLAENVMKIYQEMFGKIPVHDFYLLDYDFGFNRENYIPADIASIPHELAHFWWNFPEELWLSEGFATYAESLYTEKTKGQPSFYQALDSLKKKAIRSIKAGLDLPLVGSGYHSLLYNKGALVVHALKLELGDSLFFKTLQSFMAKFHKKGPTWKDLCSIAETLSGRDLKFFFEQWLLRSGLPQLELYYEVTKDGERFRINGKVIQQGLFYRLSSKLVISGKGKEEKHDLFLDREEASFTFPLSFEPEVVDLELEKGIPCFLKGAGLSARKSSLEEEGNKALLSHEYERALENFKKLLELSREEEEIASASYNLAKALFGLGRYSEASDRFKKALDYAHLPQNTRCACVLYLGKTSLCEGKLEEAKEYFNQLIADVYVPESYKTDAARFSQYLGLIKPSNEVIKLIDTLQKATNEKDEATLKSMNRWLPKDKDITSLAKYPFTDFKLRIELVLDAGDNKYYVECFASGMRGKTFLCGDFIILVQKIDEEIRLIDVVKIQMST